MFYIIVNYEIMDKIQSCLASNMKRYRKQLHFSQERLAEEAKASTNYIASSLNVDSLDLFDKGGFEFQNLEDLRSEVLESVVKSVNAVFDKTE